MTLLTYLFQRNKFWQYSTGKLVKSSPIILSNLANISAFNKLGDTASDICDAMLLASFRNCWKLTLEQVVFIVARIFQSRLNSTLKLTKLLLVLVTFKFMTTGGF